MTTLLLVFVTLRVITAASAIEASGEDTPVRVSCIQQALKTRFWVLGPELSAATPRVMISPFLAFSRPFPGPGSFLSNEGKANHKG